MKSPSNLILSLLCGLALAACGTESQGPGAQVLQNARSLFAAGARATPPGPDDLLTRDVIDTVTVPYGMIGIERRGAYASMTLAGQNGAFDSWVTSDGAGVVLQGAVLTGTKGLGPDLVTADIGALAQGFGSSGGPSSRTHRYLDGEGRAFTLTYTCTISAAGDENITIVGKTYATRIVTETCESAQESFENRYWIGKNDGIVWQSRQWVSAGIGHVLLLTFVPVAR
jgi:Group 4 capsule polysaccharide lipoprotein gfcB, YjbF